ncbi:MAG: hypothetical protein QXR16_01240 [Candidatus Micrarchaeaceae archaeon]
MNKITLFVVALLLATTIGLVLSFASGAYSLTYVLLFSFASLPLALLFAKGYLDLRTASRLKNEYEEGIDALGSLCYYRQKGKSVISTIEKVARVSSCAETTGSLKRARLRIAYGDDPASALSVTFSKSNPLFNGFNLARGTNIYASIKKYLDEKSSESEHKNAIREASLQRYATFNMFLSSVLPSFVIFIFVAESILNSSGNNLLFLSLAMLEVIPMLYFFGNAALFRRLFE